MGHSNRMYLSTEPSPVRSSYSGFIMTDSNTKTSSAAPHLIPPKIWQTHPDSSTTESTWGPQEHGQMVFTQMSSRLTQQGTCRGNWQSQKMVNFPELHHHNLYQLFASLFGSDIISEMSKFWRSVVIKWIGSWLSTLIYPISDCQSAFSYNRKYTKLALLVLTTTKKKVYQLR